MGASIDGAGDGEKYDRRVTVAVRMPGMRAAGLPGLRGFFSVPRKP